MKTTDLRYTIILEFDDKGFPLHASGGLDVCPPETCPTLEQFNALAEALNHSLQKAKEKIYGSKPLPTHSDN